MTRVFIADALAEERSALRLLLVDLHLEVIGEAADWGTTLAHAPGLRPKMLLIDWSILPGDNQSASLATLREESPDALVIVLISHLHARQQAALSSGADSFISRRETSEQVAERLQVLAAAIHPGVMHPAQV